MAKPILIAGQTGKTMSLRNLDPKKTIIGQGIIKLLPFWNKGTYNIKKRNIGPIKKMEDAINILKLANHNKDITCVVLDDLHGLFEGEYFRLAKEMGFDIYPKIGQDLLRLMEAIHAMREDLFVVVCLQTDVSEQGVKIKTIGKMLEEKFSFRSYFSIALQSCRDDDEYFFMTNAYGIATSPLDMFEDKKIPNDMKEVMEWVNSFYETEERECEVEESEESEEGGENVE